MEERAEAEQSLKDGGRQSLRSDSRAERRQVEDAVRAVMDTPDVVLHQPSR